MKSFEAIQRAIDGKTVIHAKELHLSTSTVNKWQEPSTDYTDSGAFNPLDRIEKIIETSIKQGTPRKDALAPLQYLADQFNCLLVPLPEVPPTLKNLQIALSETITEFGKLVSVSGEALEDFTISQNERQAIEKKGQHLMFHLGAYLQSVKEASSR